MSDVDDAIRGLEDSWSKSNIVESKNCPKCGQPMEHWKTGEGENEWVCQKCNFAIPVSKMASYMIPLRKRLVKYFVHGIAFSGLFFVLEIAWAFTGVFLILIGSLIGLIIGMLLLPLIVGAANSVVSRFVWGFSMKDSAMNIFFHGLVLFIILLAFDLVMMVPVWIYVGNSIVIAAKFIVSCFFYGLIGKRVAEMWRE